jgi:hypothetical protein
LRQTLNGGSTIFARYATWKICCQKFYKKYPVPTVACEQTMYRTRKLMSRMAGISSLKSIFLLKNVAKQHIEMKIISYLCLIMKALRWFHCVV